MTYPKRAVSKKNTFEHYKQCILRLSCASVSLCKLRKNFIWHFKYFSYFSQKAGFEISCKLSRQFAWNIKALFLIFPRKQTEISCNNLYEISKPVFWEKYCRYAIVISPESDIGHRMHRLIQVYTIHTGSQHIFLLDRAHKNKWKKKKKENKREACPMPRKNSKYVQILWKIFMYKNIGNSAEGNKDISIYPKYFDTLSPYCTQSILTTQECVKKCYLNSTQSRPWSNCSLRNSFDLGLYCLFTYTC